MDVLRGASAGVGLNLKRERERDRERCRDISFHEEGFGGFQGLEGSCRAGVEECMDLLRYILIGLDGHRDIRDAMRMTSEGRFS